MAGATKRSVRRTCLKFAMALTTLGSALPGLAGGVQASEPAAANVNGLLSGSMAGFLSVPARSWAVETATNEIAIVEHPGSYLRYHQRLIDAKGDEMRDVIETKDGTVARLIMRDNRPLTPEEDRSERDRLNFLLTHPNDFSKHAKSQAESKKIAIDLIKLMPDAMLYSYAAGQPQTPNAPAQEVVLDFTPNPAFHPPSLYSEALLGLRGRIWIDAQTKEIVRIEGNIFQSINWGWGMLAHIYPGGTVDLEQMAACGPRWNMTQFHEQVTVKALMVKTMKVHSEGQSSGFQALPGPISYTDAIHQLLDTPLPR
jgi:hypothetical protein